jgi:DNA primase large subunit
MHIMYDRLAAEHHLKHNGRLELGLFLKAIGMPLEQALLFWRTMFGPR